MDKFINWFKGLFSNAFKAFVKAVFTKAKQQVISALQDIALKAVTELQDTDLKNEEKRMAAFLKIKDYAIARGIQAGDSTINLTIEMAVAALKG